MVTGTETTLPGLMQSVLGVYGYFFPLLLYVLWNTLALWDVTNREDMSSTSVWAWSGAVFLLPFAGAISYLLFGGAALPARTVRTAIAGGAALYALVIFLGTMVGGIS